MFTARLILAITSTLAVEVAMVVIWRWVLPEWEIEVPLAVLIGVMIGWAIFAVLDFWFVTHILKKQALVGLPTMVGCKGKVVSPLAPDGLVNIRSELWGAESTEGDIKKGEPVTVIGHDGLKLIVRRVATDKPGKLTQ